jgi:hypothetical protein
MKVIATAMGFYGGVRRRKNDEFEFRGNKPASWMMPLEKPVQPEEQVAKEEVSKTGENETAGISKELAPEPKTLSEMAKANDKATAKAVAAKSGEGTK